MNFEWSEAKRLQNIEKHHIDFLRATEVFEHEHYICRSDKNAEERYVAVGKAGPAIIAVIYTLRNDVIRIISARKARDNEKRRYQTFFH